MDRPVLAPFASLDEAALLVEERPGEATTVIGESFTEFRVPPEHVAEKALLARGKSRRGAAPDVRRQLEGERQARPRLCVHDPDEKKEVVEVELQSVPQEPEESPGEVPMSDADEGEWIRVHRPPRTVDI